MGKNLSRVANARVYGVPLREFSCRISCKSIVNVVGRVILHIRLPRQPSVGVVFDLSFKMEYLRDLASICLGEPCVFDRMPIATRRFKLSWGLGPKLTGLRRVARAGGHPGRAA
jgi:hypothetical protein